MQYGVSSGRALAFADWRPLSHSCFTITDSFISCFATSWPAWWSNQGPTCREQRRHYNMSLTVTLQIHSLPMLFVFLPPGGWQDGTWQSWGQRKMNTAPMWQHFVFKTNRRGELKMRQCVTTAWKKSWQKVVIHLIWNPTCENTMLPLLHRWAPQWKGDSLLGQIQHNYS